jgi:hypothetical protein
MKGTVVKTSKTTIQELENHIEKSFDTELGVKIVRQSKKKEGTLTQVVFHDIFKHTIQITKQGDDGTEVAVKPGLTFNGLCILWALFFAGIVPGIVFYFYSEYMQELKGKDVIRIVKENKELLSKSSVDKFGRIQRGMTDSEALEAAKNMEKSGRYEEAAETYDKLGMYEQAKSCRALISKNIVNIGHLGDISLVDSVMIGSDGGNTSPQLSSNSTDSRPPFNYQGEVNDEGYEICEYPKTSGVMWWKDYNSQTWVKWE